MHRAAYIFVIAVLLIRTITAIFVLAAPLLVPIFAPGFSGEIRDLTVTLSQILFPILIMLGASGMVVGVLNSYDRFAAFAVALVAIGAAFVAVSPAPVNRDCHLSASTRRRPCSTARTQCW